MRFSIKREELLKASEAAKRGVSSRSTLPILNNLLLEVEGSRLTVTGYDLEIGARSAQDVTDAEPGAITLPAKALVEWAKGCAKGATVECVTDETSCATLTSGGRTTHLKGLPAEEFPRLPAQEDPPELEALFEASEFVATVGGVLASASTDDARPILAGVLCAYEGAQLRLTATDGPRLGTRLAGVASFDAETIPRRMLRQAEQQRAEAQTESDRVDALGYSLAEAEKREVEGFAGWGCGPSVQSVRGSIASAEHNRARLQGSANLLEATAPRHTGEAVECIIPARCLKTAAALAKKCKGVVGVQFWERQAQVLLPDGTLIQTRLVDGRYPNWQRVMPGAAEHTVVFDRREMLAALAAVEGVVRKDGNKVAFLFNGHAELSAQSQELGTATATCPATFWSGQDEAEFRIALSARYMRDALDSFTEDAIRLELREPDAAVVFLPVGVANEGAASRAAYLQMPMVLPKEATG
jgi:DNA polymerase III sliding clamp (beta) subunit (PCNA family)